MNAFALRNERTRIVGERTGVFALRRSSPSTARPCFFSWFWFSEKAMSRPSRTKWRKRTLGIVSFQKGRR